MSTCPWRRSFCLTSEDQVHRGREESDLGQEDFSDARNLDDVLRILIFRRFSSRIHRFASHALRLERPDWVCPSVPHRYALAHTFSNSLFISIPVDLTSDPELAKLEEKGVKGRYVSVETIKELPSGNTEWRMATSSSPGGRIPTFLVESSMASSISAVSIQVNHMEQGS